MRIMFGAILAVLASAIAHAGVKVTALDWQVQGERGRFVVTLDAPVTSTPEWDVKGGRFAMTLPGADIEQNTVRKVGGVRLAAANTARGVLTTLTFPGGAINADAIALTMKDGTIEVSTAVPKGAAAPATTTKTESSPFTVKSPVAMKKGQVTKEALGEEFLKKIEEEVNQGGSPAPAVAAAPAANKPKIEVMPAVTHASLAPKDEIRTAQAAPARENNGFSFATYAGKFIAFLGVVLLFFWGVVQLMKKGVLSKSKLGFLNNGQLVTVLSTTYIAPKRSVLLIKAHNQAFLVSSSESGMQFIAEVRDVPGMVKEGERAIAGHNFDDSVVSAEKAPATQELRVKEDIYQSTPVEEKGGVQKDIVRFSDELKKKVKNLRSLQ